MARVGVGAWPLLLCVTVVMPCSACWWCLVVAGLLGVNLGKNKNSKDAATDYMIGACLAVCPSSLAGQLRIPP